MTTPPHEPVSRTQFVSRIRIPDILAAGNHARVRSRHWLAAVIVAVVLIPVALWGWTAFETRANALAAALADERRVTEAVGVHTLKLLESQAFALDLVDRTDAERDCPGLRSDALAQDFIHSVAQSPQTQALWIINADGTLCMANDPMWMDNRSRNFRDYFIWARGAAPGRYYVGRALIGLIDKRPAFTVAKARRKDGAFNGVLLASVSLTDLVQYWENVIGILPTQRIALLRQDGATIARSWQPLVPDPDPAVERGVAAAWRTAADGSTLSDAAIDGTRRLSAWRSLADWGVVVTSSVGEDAVLAPWRRSTAIYGCVAALVSALLGTLLWSLLRERSLLERAVQQRTGALRTSEQRLALFIDRAPAAIAMFDTDMRYLVASRRYLEDYGLTSSAPESLWGRSHYKVFPTIPDRWREIHRRVLAGETLSADDEPFPREDGRQDWVRWEMGPWYTGDGRLGGAVLFSEVVTARKRAEAELQQTTALLRAIGNSSPDAIYAKDTEGRFVFANPAVLAVIGRRAEEVIGRTDAEWHDDPQQAAAVTANDRRIVESGQAEVLEETWTAAGLGTRVFRSAKAPLRTEDGKVLGVVAVSSDITPLKDVEAKLRTLTEDLAERVREEAAAREEAQACAAHAQRMQALGQLAGGIAHDFNNLLQAVQGAAGLIERRATDPVSVKRFARTVAEAAERGAAITRRLLAFARRGDLRAERIHLAGLLEGLRDVLAQTLGSPIAVRVEIESELAALMADRSQLETVLVNLATNARDAMPEGGTLTLGAAAEEVTAERVHSAGLRPGRYVVLAVADTGTGMDRATLERALEPFFTTKPQDKGTGLGLSMAKGFAEQSGGALAIESAPGQGTTVTLWLPVADERKQAAQLQPGLALVAGLERRVLVVDDEDLVREMLVVSLEDAGFAVLAAGNGAEALALLDAGEPVDALVSDLSMPGMGGLTLIREAQGRRPGLPAVLLTGYAGEAAHLAVSGAPPGSFSLLRKPVSVGQLVDRIEMVLAAKTRSAR